MQSGRLKERVLIQHKTITGQDSYGQNVESYTASTSGPYWAEFIEQGGREFYRLQQRFAEARAGFKIRFVGIVINREDRIQWQNRSRTFDIIGVDEPIRKRELVIACRELVA